MLIILAILTYSIWSSTFALAKLALQYSPPVFLTGVRMLLSSLFLLGYLLIFSRNFFKLKAKEWLSLGLLALFSIYLANILEFWALQYLSSSKACFIYSFSPFFTALFSYLYFNEKMTLQKVLGLLVGLLGILPVLVLQTDREEELFNISAFLSLPALAIIGATLCSVYGWILLRLIVKDRMISPIMANGGSMMLGGLVATSHSFFTEKWQPFPVELGDVTHFLGWTILMALISNLLCYNLYGWLLKRLTATLLSFIGTFSPIFASIHGKIFLGEPFSWVIILSTGVVALGLWMVYATELRQGYLTASN